MGQRQLHAQKKLSLRELPEDLENAEGRPRPAAAAACIEDIYVSGTRPWCSAGKRECDATRKHGSRAECGAPTSIKRTAAVCNAAQQQALRINIEESAQANALRAQDENAAKSIQTRHGPPENTNSQKTN